MTPRTRTELAALTRPGRAILERLRAIGSAFDVSLAALEAVPARRDALQWAGHFAGVRLLVAYLQSGERRFDVFPGRPGRERASPRTLPHEQQERGLRGSDGVDAASGGSERTGTRVSPTTGSTATRPTGRSASLERAAGKVEASDLTS